mmetsp:Transcript_171206/g.548860  ORF Transcript_171206/g.548860 Transcript_171206/m.548860 type:complete len:317 (-) Transcript_171206:231-1181(-)
MPGDAGQRCRPNRAAAEQLVAQQQRRRGEARGPVPEHADVEERELQDVSGQLAMEVVAAMANLKALQKMNGRRNKHLPLQDGQELALGLEDVTLRARVIRHVDELLCLRRVDLFKLCSDEQCHGPNQLQTLAGHLDPRKVAIQNAHCEEECLLLQAVLVVHADQPINQNSSHLGSDLLLRLHVRGARQALELPAEQALEDVGQVLRSGVLPIRLRAQRASDRARRGGRCWRCGDRALWRDGGDGSGGFHAAGEAADLGRKAACRPIADVLEWAIAATQLQRSCAVQCLCSGVPGQVRGGGGPRLPAERVVMRRIVF